MKEVFSNIIQLILFSVSVVLLISLSILACDGVLLDPFFDIDWKNFSLKSALSEFWQGIRSFNLNEDMEEET